MEKMTLLDHLDELRRRVIRAAIVLAVTTGVCLFFSKPLFHWFQLPMLRALGGNGTFIATAPTEGIVTYLKLSLVAGVLLGCPFLFYQLWRFIAPGLKPQESRLILPFVISSSLLFVGGALFGYFVVFPAGFAYFVAVLADTHIQFMPMMGSYLSFGSRLLLAFGAVFELPLLITFLAYAGIINHRQLRKARRYVIVGIFTLAAVLTPGPDIISQVLLAVPLWILYEAGILLARIFGKSPALNKS